MSEKASRGGAPVTFADGVIEDVSSLVASVENHDLDALKRRIAELLIECKANPYPDGERH
jgi:hypothetical protein